ncbi:DUF6531 domain-containing protein [Microlunatus speluncae]|uniref:DUF6531 domain-containing protein n=1 Tax=Microlunatus speluncae TaxID=2594267 RepID=UPI00126664E8|nr:DUF6531 domain-containing protein [Microlunatus speluncae]
MVDISDLGAIDEKVPFDHDVADALIAAFDAAATDIDGQTAVRATSVSTGTVDFKGHFSELFSGNASVAAADATELISRLREVATGARTLKTEATKEQQRRDKARTWKQEQDDRNVFEEFGDWIGGGEDPPVGPPADPVSITASASQNGTRQTPPPGTGASGGSSTTTSARPSNLRQFVTGSAPLNEALKDKPGALRGHLTSFASACQWGSLSADGVVTGFDQWLAANVQDVTWATTVANAFATAGGEGNITWLLNSTLSEVLSAAGIAETRQDLTIVAAQAYGHPPTTGYADDPVNTATGNFVETELDLGFAGAAAELEFSRTYNAVDGEGGAFGPGWSSVLDVRLELADDGATMVLADGRRVLIPRLGDGWDRAPGEKLWLHRVGSGGLVVSDNDGLRRTFTAGGLWTSVSRGPGTKITAERDDEGRLIRLAHERGRWIEIGWTAHRVTEVRASDGRRASFGYDDAGRLASATGPLGTRTYRWNDAGLIEAVIAADGTVEVENSYDEQRRVAGQRSPFGRETRYTYLPGRITVVSDRDGDRSNTWVADQRGRLVRVVDADGHRQAMNYDGFGNVVSATERNGAVTTHGYDERGRRLRTRTPAGADLTFGYDDADRVTTVVTESGAVTEYSYAGADRNPSVITDPEGGRTELTWDGALLRQVVDPVGVRLRFDYDQHGDLVAVIDAADHRARLDRDAAGRVIAAITPSGARTTFHYDAAGLLASRRDPNGAIHRFEHSAGGRPTATIDPYGGRTELEYGPHGEVIKTIDPLGRATTSSYDDLGNLAAVELPDGSSWRFVHDALSRLRQTIDPSGGSWRREYDANGEVTSFTDPTGLHRTLAADPAGRSAALVEAEATSALKFDQLGRPVAAEEPDGSTRLISYDRCGRAVELVDGEGQLTLLRRDPAGRLVELVAPSGAITRYEYDACGRPAAVTDPTGGRIERQYDADGRVVREVSSTGEVAWSDYDAMGWVVARFQPGEGLTRYGYDLMGRLIRQTDPWHGPRRFRYDAAGQLVEATGGNGGITRYDYDALGRVIMITDPLGGVTRRSYDPMGRLIAETDPLGRTTTAEYDAAGRQLTRTDPCGRRTERTFRAGQEATLRIDGRLIAEISRDLRDRRVIIADHSDPERSTEHELSWNGRRQLITRRRGEGRVEWTYDSDGRRATMTTPDGHRTRYERDETGRLTAVDHPLLGRATFGYDASGRLVRAAAGDLIQTWGHAAGFVVEHTLTGLVGSTRTRLERDESGRICSLTADSGRRTFGYDEAGQLVEERAEDGTGSSWVFDRAGRLTAEAIDGTRRDHCHDAAGQLVSTSTGEARVSYHYDQAGRRVRAEASDGRVREFAWSEVGGLSAITDRDATGATRTTRLWVDVVGELGRVDGAETWWDSAESYAPGLIQAGDSPVVPTAGGLTGVGGAWHAAGWRTARAASPDPWAVAPVADLTAGMRVGAAGELLVGGLEWMGARAYDPATRAFLSVDQLEPVTGAGWSGNPYAFAGNDPLHALDPAGLSPVTDEELKAYAASNDGAWNAATEWVGDNWEYLAGGAMVLAGGVLMATGVGGPAGMALLSAGADTIIQKATTGTVNWGQVAISGVVGGVGGGLAGLAAKASKGGLAALRARVGVYGTIGAVSSEATYVTQNWNNLSWRGALGAGAGGFVAGAFSGGRGPGGGSLATAVGQNAKGLAARGFTAGLGFVGGFSGSVTNNVVSGNPINLTGALVSGGLGAGTSQIPKIYNAPSGTSSTLQQVSHYGPRFSNLASFGNHGTQALYVGAIQSSVQSYGANVLVGSPLQGHGIQFFGH